jgi:hypothetical protein
MRSSVATVVAVAAAVLLAACSNDTTPTRIMGPSARSADAIPSTCDITNISQAGKAYFTSSKDPVFNTISTLKTDLRNFGVGTQTTGDVFSILGRVAAVRLTSATVGAGAGATFVDAVLACASWANSIPASFNASAALGSGIFSVSPSGAVEAFVGTSAGNAVAASPRWGAEPVTGNTWPAGPYLVYGYPAVGTDPSGGFELGTLPAGQVTESSGHLIQVGICTATTVVDANGKPTAANLLVHNGSEILALVPLRFCNSQPILGSNATSWFTRLASGVKSYFSPASAWAQDGGDNFIGGLPSGWSPFQPKLFAASDDTLSFFVQPVNTTTGSLPITVQVKAVSGTTLPPLNVRLTIAGNHGTPAFLTQSGTSTDHLDASTDANGIATFTFGFTKAGGYTLTATGYLGGSGGVVATSPALSALFQVQNK